MELREKSLLEALQSLGGSGDWAAITSARYFPNADLPLASDALIQSGLVQVDSYNGNNPMAGWAVLSITPAGHAALENL